MLEEKINTDIKTAMLAKSSKKIRSIASQK